MRLLPMLALAALAANAAEIPQAPPDITLSFAHAWCATDPALNARLERIDRAARDRVRRREGVRAAAMRPAAGRFDNGVFILQRDDVTVPFDIAFDLQGTSFLFERLGTDQYRITREALQYDDNIGLLLTRLSSRDSYVTYNLTKFVFPFYGAQMQRMHLGASPAIHFERPAIVSEGQYGPLEMISERKPMIAPLLFARGNLFNPASVYTREETDRLIVTWRSLSGSFRYDIQAVLFANGNVRFAYKEAMNAQGTAFAFTSGVEATRNERVSLLSGTDPRGDTRSNIPAALKEMIDIESVSFERVGGSELIEISIKLAQPISATALSENDRLSFIVFFDSEYETYAGFVHVNGSPEFFLSAWGNVDPNRVRIDGSTITFPVLQRYLPAGDRITVATYAPAFGDELTMNVTLPPAARIVDSNISEIESTTFDQPLIESFTLGVLNPDGIWDQIESAYELTESDYDGVAIYQTFYTDIITFATAYSTVGNAGADGVWYSGSSIGERFPRRPALLHMNKVGHSVNGSARGASFLLHHEFGHHWLYNTRIRENGALSNVLNPISAHPAQYVHTPAMHSVFVASEYSAMGGSNFTQLPDGTFQTPTELGYYGYSAHELYLMGLAPPGEVSDWYIIQNSTPELGKAYHPPVNSNYGGVKKAIAFQQLLDGMGPRKPAYETSPKEFKVLFVLMERPGDPATPEAIASVAGYARNFVDSFSKATGARGAIKLTEALCLAPSFTLQPGSVAVTPGATATLTIDVSGSEPISIQWYRGLTGDTSSPISGATSKSYTTPPIASLTNFWARATNACGSKESSSAVVTIAAPHRRGARR